MGCHAGMPKAPSEEMLTREEHEEGRKGVDRQNTSKLGEALASGANRSKFGKVHRQSHVSLGLGSKDEPEFPRGASFFPTTVLARRNMRS
eukprot:2532002-Amphidinium_carterae.8